MRYISSPDFHRDGAERIGILLVNSGTPTSAEPREVRKFLRRFLGDPRVVEIPRALWLPILYGFILPFRPARSARKYRKIWTAYGSPLLDLSERLRSELTTTLSQNILAPLTVELGMLYSKPTVAEALGRLRESGAQRILVLPMFPQYCGATTGAVCASKVFMRSTNTASVSSPRCIRAAPSKSHTPATLDAFEYIL